MARLLIFSIFSLSFLQIQAKNLKDSTDVLRFKKLATQMRLKNPKLEEGEYEVRIWNSQALRYGEAHMLYVLTRTEKQFTITKYIINSDQQGFRFATRSKPTVAIKPVLWKRLLQQNILTLPDQSSVFERLYPKVEPLTDTIQTAMEADGSFTIKANKTPKRRPIVGDGERFFF